MTKEHFRPSLFNELADWAPKIPELYAAATDLQKQALFNIPESVELVTCLPHPTTGTWQVEFLITEDDRGWADLDRLLQVMGSYFSSQHSLEIQSSKITAQDEDESQPGIAKSRVLRLHLARIKK